MNGFLRATGLTQIKYQAEMEERMRGVVMPFEECLNLPRDTESFFVWVAYDTKGDEVEMVALFKLAVEIDRDFFDIEKEPISNIIRITYPAPFIKH